MENTNEKVTTKKEGNARKKIIFSGIQPTGTPALGNYIGAMQNWITLHKDYNCLFCVVDMHSITVRQDPAGLRKKSRDLSALYIAMGIDPVANIIYCQSHVAAHAELAWILNCYTYMGELSRMTQFKEKSQRHADNINAGLFDYPVLMAADILLYQTDLVPVGDDQKQHLELTRDVAARFNNIYGSVFTIPEPYIPKLGARIMSLQEPDKKMSKSETDNINNAVFLLDEPNIIMSKIKKAVTDSGSEIRYSDDKPGISNLLTIYSCLTGKTLQESEKDFDGKNYGEFKAAVGEIVVASLSPVQKEFRRISADKGYIDGILKSNAEKAAGLADRIMQKVKKKVGFVQI